MVVYNHGLGDDKTPGMIASGVVTAGGVATAVVSSSSALMATLGLTAATVPIFGAVVAAVGLAIVALGIGKGCGSTCTASTKIVNDREPFLQQNLAAAQQQASINGGCLTSAEVQILTSAFDRVWNDVLANCGAIPAPGGTQCINDRQRGGKWDWFKMYRDPISAFPVCQPTTVSSVASSVASVASSLSISPNMLAIGAGVIGLMWALGD